MKETLKDWLFNTWLQLRNWVNRIIYKGSRAEWRYALKDSFRGVWLFGDDDFRGGLLRNKPIWIINLWWGSYAKDEKVSYMSKDCIATPNLYKEEREFLKLRTLLNPQLNEYNGVSMPWARGSIQKKDAIRTHGYFEVNARIPKAEGIWHAPLWFVAAGKGDEIKVLPEIDVAEVYYKNGKAQVKTNIHFGEDYEENARNIGSRTHYVPNFWNRFVTYGLLWLPDRLEFYYDGWLVRRITDRRILDRLTDGLIPIINVSVQPGEKHYGSYMEVESFRYWERRVDFWK